MPVLPFESPMIVLPSALRAVAVLGSPLVPRSMIPVLADQTKAWTLPSVAIELPSFRAVTASASIWAH